MSDDATIEVHIEPEIRDRASEVLAQSGLTINEAVRNLLAHVAAEGTVPFEAQADDQAYDAWFRAQVQEALDDPRPGLGDEEVRAEFAARRAAILARLGSSRPLESSGRSAQGLTARASQTSSKRKVRWRQST
jgi:DNA-damage-inducible protein J